MALVGYACGAEFDGAIVLRGVCGAGENAGAGVAADGEWLASNPGTTMTEVVMQGMDRSAGGPRKRVVVIGGGFAGIRAASTLGRFPVDVTLVDRKNHHTFQPLLYQVALAVLSPADIAQPIRSLVRGAKNTQVLMDEVTGIDTSMQRVTLKTGSVLEYDYLIMATGSTHSYFGKDEWAKIAPGLKTIEDAIEIRRRVLLAFELAEREMLETGTHPALNFVIIGGGPTGVELAGAISDIARLYMTKDFRHIDPSSAQVLILEGSPKILGSYPPDLQAKAVEQLKHLGVICRTGAHVTDVQPGYVMVGDERVDSVCTLWGAGVQASPLGKMLGVQTDKRGAVMVDAQLNPTSADGKAISNVFICGDLAHVDQDGKQVPGVAQPAIQMGTYAAKRIGLKVAGKPGPKGFRYFRQGRHGDHRTGGRGGRHQVAVQGPLERFSGVGGMADGAHLLPDRVPEPAGDLYAVGVDVSDLQRRRAADYRKPGAAGMGHADCWDGRADACREADGRLIKDEEERRDESFREEQ